VVAETGLEPVTFGL